MKDSMKKMSKVDIEAKKDVLKELMQMAMGELRGKNKSGLDEMMNMKKVAVMAPDKEGLKAGLEKAEDVLEQMPEGEEEDEMDSEDSEESESSEELSDEQKKMMLKKLMKKG